MRKKVLRMATVALFGVLLLAGTVGCNAGAKGGMPDYCYIETHVETITMREGMQFYNLYGHRKWSSDARMGMYKTIDEAVSAAAKLNCPFKY